MIGFEIFILFLAGLGAGMVTGLLGASAVMVAAPLMILFLDYSAFSAVGISLATDVFASLTTAYVFHKHGNINIKPAIPLLIFAVVGAYLGSYFSSSFDTSFLSKIIGLSVMLTGFNFMKRGVKWDISYLEKKFKLGNKKVQVVFLAILGLIVGLIAGTFGAGGGITLLIVLVLLLKYKVHMAIGTSVLVMAFIALSGTIGHVVYDSVPFYPFVIASVGGVLGAYFVAHKTNTLSEERLNKLIGLVFFVLGFLLFLKELLYLF
jgi:uncharacterized protein